MYKTNIPLARLVGSTGSEIKGGNEAVSAFGTIPVLLCPADDSDDFVIGPSGAPIMPDKCITYKNKKENKSKFIKHLITSTTEDSPIKKEGRMFHK